MKILITGYTATHINSERIKLKVASFAFLLRDALLDMGHEVEQRKVIPGESLQDYDKVIVFMGSVTTRLNKYSHGALYCIGLRDDVLLAFDDWRVNDFVQSSITFKNEKIYEPRLKKIDFQKWLEYDKIILKGADRLKEIKNWKNQLLIPCYDVGTNNDFHLPQDKIVRLDATSYIALPELQRKEKEYKWVVAAIGNRDSYLKTLNLNWEILTFCKEHDKILLTEDEVVQKYSENWGVLSPQYTGRNDISNTGWYRSRFLHSSYAGSILLSSEKEGKTFGGPYEFDYVKSIEDNPHRVEEVAKEQREWLEKILWDKNRLHEEIKKSIL